MVPTPPGTRWRLQRSCNRTTWVGVQQRPPCESALCHFGADCYFPLFARPRRLAHANGPKSRGMRTASASLGGSSVAKSRTVGLISESQRPEGRRLFLPGWGAGIRTPEWRYQKPLPYHLATPQCRERRTVMQFARRMQLPESSMFRRSFSQLWTAPSRDHNALSIAFSAVALGNESRYRPRSVGV